MILWILITSLILVFITLVSHSTGLVFVRTVRLLLENDLIAVSLMRIGYFFGLILISLILRLLALITALLCLIPALF